MRNRRLLQFGDNPWGNGLRLAVLNAALAVVCIVTFLGTLLVVSSLNQLMLNRGGNASAELPFPYPLLLLSYVIMYLVAWVWIGQRLPSAGRARFVTALVGAGPLFGLSLLGYFGTVAALVVNEFEPDATPAAAFFVFGGLSTLILLAGIACVGLILLCGVCGIGKSTQGTSQVVGHAPRA